MLQALAAFEDSTSPEKAGKAWAAAADLWPEEPLVWLGVGNAAHRTDDRAGALISYRRALELDPGHLPARLNLAVSLGEDGDPCAALEVLDKPPPRGHPLAPTFAATTEELGRACSPTTQDPESRLPFADGP